MFLFERNRRILRATDDQGTYYNWSTENFRNVHYLHETGQQLFIALLQELLGISLIQNPPVGIARRYQVSLQPNLVTSLRNSDRITFSSATREVKLIRGADDTLIPWGDRKGKKEVWFLDNAKVFQQFAELLADCANMNVVTVQGELKRKACTIATFNTR